MGTTRHQMTDQGTTFTQLAPLDLSAAVTACGTARFQKTLLATIANFLGAESSGIMQYSRYAIPHYLVRDHVPEREMDIYLAGTYRFDPFFRLWRETGQSGVIDLAQLGQSNGRVGENAKDYILRFQPTTRMADEVALLCPKIGGAVDNYFFLRGTPFRDRELESLRANFATIYALHRLNQRLILNAMGENQGADAGFPDTDVFVIDDSNGRQTFTSRNWQQVVGQNVALSDAVQTARQSESGTPVMLGHAHVLSEQLGEDFSPAPNGRITFVVQRPLASPSLVFSEVLDQLFADHLTDREISICNLVLRGFPSTTIADKLGIALGTVKNHRKRIYRKLDITTERELFLLLLNHIGAPSH